MNSQNDEIIRLSDVSLLRDGRNILEHVDLVVHKGDFIAMTGPNGGGKTTLLRIVLGLLCPTSGKVWKKPGISVGYLPQKNMIDSHFPISVSEVVASGLLSTQGLSKSQRESKINETLEAIQLTAQSDRPIGKLSGGQVQRTLLGRAIISQPELLVLDEPLSYIDKRFEAHLYKLISKLAQSTTILLVSHEMSEIASMANRHVIIDHTVHDCHAAHHYIRPECDE